MAINNVKVLLEAPSSYKMKQSLINVPVIESKNSRGVDFYLEPKQCGVSNISGTVIYRTASGTKKTINIRKMEVQIKCPLVCTSMSTIEDCQVAIQTLGNDARAFLIADLDPRLVYTLIPVLLLPMKVQILKEVTKERRGFVRKQKILEGEL